MNEQDYPHVLFSDFADKNGHTIREHSYAAPMLLVLLRHIGCSFCRKTLHELSKSMPHISGCGYNVGLVHMDPDHVMQERLGIYGLESLPRFHDPDRILYNALGLSRAPLSAIFNTGVWKRGVRAKKAYGSSWPKTDPMQLPGVFLIDQGRSVAGEPMLSPDETPDFLELLIRSEAVA